MTRAFARANAAGITGVMLCGGRSSRMAEILKKGCGKDSLVLGGETIGKRIIGKLIEMFGRAIVVTSEEGMSRFRGIRDARCRVVPDIVKGKGPVGGLYTGLIESGTEKIFAVSCDMPFIEESIIRKIVLNAEGHDCAIPFFAGRKHSLHAVYSKSCIPALKKMLDMNELAVRQLHGKVRTRIIRPGRSEGKMWKTALSNLNTADDYIKALEAEGAV